LKVSAKAYSISKHQCILQSFASRELRAKMHELCDRILHCAAEQIILREYCQGKSGTAIQKREKCQNKMGAVKILLL
jgi:hypothetical protein